MPESNPEWSSNNTHSAVSHRPSAAITRRLNGLALECFVPTIIAVVVVVVAAAGADNQSAGKPRSGGSPPYQQARDVEAGETRLAETAANHARTDNPRLTPKPSQSASAAAPADSIHRTTAYRPYSPSLPRMGPAVYRPADSRIIEQQQRAYELAERARRQHWKNVQAYRAAVEQRIRQARGYWPRQRQDG